MQPRLDVLTPGVPDLDAARRFYIDGLGWEPLLEVPGEIVLVQSATAACSRCGARTRSRPTSSATARPAAATRHQAPA